MLPLRFLVLASLAGICLWGLFSLLENLREPELLRSPKAVVVKGCDPIETPEAARLCPQFRCQKALLDSKIVARSARFQITVQRKASATELIGGFVKAGMDGKPHFACVLESGVVSGTRLVSSQELSRLASASGEWSL